MARFAVVVLSLLLVVPHQALAQSASASDPQALKLATQAVAALTGGVPVTDVTLSANVIWVAGSEYDTGTGTLAAKGEVESRIDLNLGEKTRSEIRTSSGGVPEGAWVAGSASEPSSAKQQPYSTHNCLTDASWFFPTLSSLNQTANPEFVFSYVGQEQHNGVSTQHLRVSRIFPEDTKNLALQALSATDFYLDPTSFLPLAIVFSVHPDADMNTNIRSEIGFANYRAVSGVLVPFHIQRMLNGTVVLDIVVNSATVNSGLQDSVFSL